jgi:predicted Zn-dependent protease
MRGSRFLLTIAGLATVVLGGCSKPGGMFKPSIAQQKKLGDQAAGDFSKKYKFATGEKLARVERVGARLANALTPEDRKTWDYRFHVIEDKEVNAFAVPGGNVYIYTGLLDRIKTDDELAAVLGHEMTHVRAQHWAQQVASNQERSTALSVVLGVAKAGNVAYTAADVVNNLADLRYSRKDEDEADEGGFYNMVDAGFDPHGMLDLFQILKDAAGKGGTPVYLRDHPMTDARIKKTQERIAALKKN